MQLSYFYRLVCLALCSAGLLLCALEASAWMMANSLLRRLPGNARRAERHLFLLALFARLSPWLVVLGAWIPAYMRGEDNHAQERVSLACISGAGCVLCWSILCGVRVLRAWMRTRRYCAACHAVGAQWEGLPVLLHPGEQPLLAVVGMFRSRIVASRPVLVPGRYPAAALEAAFRHEGAHARHRDNLKMLLLSLLPSIPFGTRKRPSLHRRWKLAAEMAADEEGAQGNRKHSVLLAELLVSMARETNRRIPEGVFALLSGAEDLRVRVDRLLEAQLNAGSPSETKVLRWGTGYAGRTLILCLGVLAALCVLGAELGHSFAEALLHLG